MHFRRELDSSWPLIGVNYGVVSSCFVFAVAIVVLSDDGKWFE
jgi:hypothetical protein